MVGRSMTPSSRSRSGIVGLALRHDFAGALNDARDARLADVHVVRFFHQHEACGAGQRIEARFG